MGQDCRGIGLGALLSLPAWGGASDFQIACEVPYFTTGESPSAALVSSA